MVSTKLTQKQEKEKEKFFEGAGFPNSKKCFDYIYLYTKNIHKMDLKNNNSNNNSDILTNLDIFFNIINSDECKALMQGGELKLKSIIETLKTEIDKKLKTDIVSISYWHLCVFYKNLLFHLLGIEASNDVICKFIFHVPENMQNMKIKSIDKIKELLVEGNDKKPINISKYIKFKLNGTKNINIKIIDISEPPEPSKPYTKIIIPLIIALILGVSAAYLVHKKFIKKENNNKINLEINKSKKLN